MQLINLLHGVYGNGTRVAVEGNNSELVETFIKNNNTMLYVLRELLKKADFQPAKITVGENSGKWVNPTLFLVRDMFDQENKVVYGWSNENNFVISISDCNIYRDGNRMLDITTWRTQLDGDIRVI